MATKKRNNPATKNKVRDAVLKSMTKVKWLTTSEVAIRSGITMKQAQNAMARMCRDGVIQRGPRRGRERTYRLPTPREERTTQVQPNWFATFAPKERAVLQEKLAPDSVPSPQPPNPLLMPAPLQNALLAVVRSDLSDEIIGSTVVAMMREHLRKSGG